MKGSSARTPLVFAIAGSAVLVVAGCTNLLGSFTLADRDAADASTMGDAGIPITPCAADADCPALDSAPPGCATATCIEGACYYQAADVDGDGRPAYCTSHGVSLGDDCVDTDPGFYVGAPCSVDGSNQITKTSPLGACVQGTIRCDSPSPTCVGAVGPSTDTCSNMVDDDCNGTVDDGMGCTCTVGTTYECKAVAKGECAKGSQICQTDGTRSMCVARREGMLECASLRDNDCDGTIDCAQMGCTETFSYCVPEGQNCFATGLIFSVGEPITKILVMKDSCSKGWTEIATIKVTKAQPKGAEPVQLCKLADGVDSVDFGASSCPKPVTLGYAWPVGTGAGLPTTQSLSKFSLTVPGLVPGSRVGTHALAAGARAPFRNCAGRAVPGELVAETVP